MKKEKSSHLGYTLRRKEPDLPEIPDVRSIVQVCNVFSALTYLNRVHALKVFFHLAHTATVCVCNLAEKAPATFATRFAGA